MAATQDAGLPVHRRTGSAPPASQNATTGPSQQHNAATRTDRDYLANDGTIVQSLRSPTPIVGVTTQTRYDLSSVAHPPGAGHPRHHELQLFIVPVSHL